MVITFETSALRQDSNALVEQNDSGFIDSNNNSRDMDFKTTFEYSDSESDDSNDDYIIDGPLWSPGLDSPNLIASPLDRRVQSLQERLQENVPRRPSLDRIIYEDQTSKLRSRHSSLDSAISNFEHLELQTEQFNPQSQQQSMLFARESLYGSGSHNLNRSAEKGNKSNHKNLNLFLSQSDYPLSYTQEQNILNYHANQENNLEMVNTNPNSVDKLSENCDSTLENCDNKFELKNSNFPPLNILEERSVLDNNVMSIDTLDEYTLDRNGNFISANYEKLYSSSENISVGANSIRLQHKEVMQYIKHIKIKLSSIVVML